MSISEETQKKIDELEEKIMKLRKEKKEIDEVLDDLNKWGGILK